jgi:hypothetical protein
MWAFLISGEYVLVDVAKSYLEACLGTSEKEEPCPPEGVIKAEEFDLPRLRLESLTPYPERGREMKAGCLRVEHLQHRVADAAISNAGTEAMRSRVGHALRTTPQPRQ